jgi:hypothetical protein
LRISYTSRWAYKYHPDGIHALYATGNSEYHQISNDFIVDPNEFGLKPESVDFITVKMMKYDAKLTHGFSRELIVRALLSDNMT